MVSNITLVMLEKMAGQSLPRLIRIGIKNRAELKRAYQEIMASLEHERAGYT